MIRLIIARHGNTFNKGEVPTRVGARTDLPLVESGREQAKKLGEYLAKFDLLPSKVYAAPLKRTMETAAGALEAAGIAGAVAVEPLDIFTEIDYGPDENKPEDEVVARVGQKAIDEWNAFAKVPDGWKVDPDKIIRDWKDFAGSLVKGGDGTTTMVVTSNGIARFAPYITGDFDAFAAAHDIKIGTGCLAIFLFDGAKWICEEWNLKPKEKLV